MRNLLQDNSAFCSNTLNTLSSILLLDVRDNLAMGAPSIKYLLSSDDQLPLTIRATNTDKAHLHKNQYGKDADTFIGLV